MKSIAIVPAVIGLSVASVIGHSSQTSRTLTRDAVVDAIRAGVSGEAAPARLDRQVLLYHPLARIALSAQMAYRQHQGPFDETAFLSALPEWITSPLVWIVFGFPCSQKADSGCETATGVSYDRHIPLLEVAADWNPSLPPNAGRVKPVMIAHDLQFLRELGDVPIEKPVVAAAFDPARLHPGQWVFAHWRLGTQDTLNVAGKVTSALLRGHPDP